MAVTLRFSVTVLAAGIMPSSAQAQPVKDYAPRFAECRAEECGKRLIVLRSFRQAGEKRILVVDPQTLETSTRLEKDLHLQRMSWPRFREAIAADPYGRALLDSETSGASHQDAGIVHALPATSGVVLTVDLCPSLHRVGRLARQEREESKPHPGEHRAGARQWQRTPWRHALPGTSSPGEGGHPVGELASLRSARERQGRRADQEALREVEFLAPNAEAPGEACALTQFNASSDRSCP